MYNKLDGIFKIENKNGSIPTSRNEAEINGVYTTDEDETLKFRKN